MQPNFLAPLSMAFYPLLVIAFFAFRRPPVALALSVLVGELVLPPNYTLPLSWPTWITKSTLVPVAVFLPALFFGRRHLRRAAPFRGAEAFFVLLVIAAFGTMWNNQDALKYGPNVLPGETFGDFVSNVIRSMVSLWVVFFLARILFRTSRDLVTLTKTLVVAASLYSIPVLLEVRVSPQICRWIYGYTPSSFIQSIRWGGYRPIVMMGHGLALSLFMLLACIFVTALARTDKQATFVPTRVLWVYLLAVLVLCKSAGSIGYALLCVPLLAFAPPRWTLRFAAVLACCVVAYPLVRLNQLVPTDKLAELAAPLSAERAESLAYRFHMDQGMIAMTLKRPWFGWGNYARNYVFDPNSGEPLTVPDSMLMFTLSSRGIFGFAGTFGAFVAVVLRACWLVPKVKTPSTRILLCGLTICCAVVLFDLLVNSTFFPVYVMLLGALAGLVPGILAEERAGKPANGTFRRPQPDAAGATP